MRPAQSYEYKQGYYAGYDDARAKRLYAYDTSSSRYNYGYEVGYEDGILDEPRDPISERDQKYERN